MLPDTVSRVNFPKVGQYMQNTLESIRTDTFDSNFVLEIV
jgi:hypothetical protein